MQAVDSRGTGCFQDRSELSEVVRNLHYYFLRRRRRQAADKRLLQVGNQVERLDDDLKKTVIKKPPHGFPNPNIRIEIYDK